MFNNLVKLYTSEKCRGTDFLEDKISNFLNMNYETCS